jgi:hypothetical protein
MAEIIMYDGVQVGDTAYCMEDHDEVAGTVVWVGSINELRRSKWYSLEFEWDFNSGVERSAEGYDLVVLDEGEHEPISLWNYMNDSAGCICFDY